MKLAALAEGLPAVQIVGDPQTDITSLAYDSRRVVPGGLFFCVPGLKADGHLFAPQAEAAGAVALVCERVLPSPLPQLVVPSARRALALLAAGFFGRPTAALRVCGITGTNGKTTSAHLLSSILDVAGLHPALLGTVVNRVAGVESPTTLTTAESLDLQAMFRRMADAGDLSCVMEVSSHALALDRTAGIEFDAVVFTNLTRDHLDFHRDVDEYFAAKRRLFLPEESRQPQAMAVVNLGDEHGRRLAGECAPAYGDDLWTYAVDDHPSSSAATVRADRLELTADSCAFVLVCERLGLCLPLELQIPARFNVANATAAAAAALAMGVAADDVRRGLAAAHGVPGRVEPVRCGQPFAVLVDYAHTPDSLENILRAVRDVTAGRLICVFGCGGDRDRGKRPLMGAAAASLADLAVITSDNPRSEDPLAIITEIRTGIAGPTTAAVVVEPDRRAAIGLAVARAAEGDAVVIAGKGHETYQILGERTISFDDREVARAALRERGWSGVAAAEPEG
jgi:UDP-N-acetylmuramoyl-L-alanyl-D-glutamate--2,6-diaminopimelate ligase